MAAPRFNIYWLLLFYAIFLCISYTLGATLKTSSEFHKVAQDFAVITQKSKRRTERRGTAETPVCNTAPALKLKNRINIVSSLKYHIASKKSQ